MTPTLLGRIQIRIILYLLVGLPISAAFAVWLAGGAFPGSHVPYGIVTIIFLVGLALDPLYIWLQSFRWDQDWPFAFQFLFMILEFAIAIFIIDQQYITWVDRAAVVANPWVVAAHFATVFAISFLCLLGIFQTFNLRWRFNGGKFTKF